VRWVSFALLPLALIAGGYWYVTGGQVMSMDDAYVEADKVGISTDGAGLEAWQTRTRRVDSDSVNLGSNPGPSATNRPDIVSYFKFPRSLE
jgi:hypothetical protein